MNHVCFTRKTESKNSLVLRSDIQQPRYRELKNPANNIMRHQMRDCALKSATIS